MKREQTPLWSEENREITMTNKSSLDELRSKLVGIRNQGYIKTHRAHDTGIGKTLEDVLGIKENNLIIPDYGEIELKSQRIDTGSMLTLATKAPKPRGTNRILYNTYKYLDDDGEFCIHSTVYGSRLNPQGFRLLLTSEKLILDNINKVEAYWPITIFDEVLKAKSERILLVFAKTKGERRKTSEHFHYIEAHLLSGLNFSKFKGAIENDKLKVDIRIGVYKSGEDKGKYHDHGTGFRISKGDFLQLYDSYQQIL